MKREIIFRINLETAEVTMEAVGWNGQGCRAATKPFEEALGIVTDRTMKPVTWNQSVETEATHVKCGGAS